jgi:hypothetical protein
MRARAIGAMALALAVRSPAGAQSAPASAVWSPSGVTHLAGSLTPVGAWDLGGPRPAPPRTTWWAPVASAAVPGSGQALLGQDRFVAYLAVEAFAWLQYAVNLREGRRQRRAYRDLAHTVARAYFGPDRPVGDFEYYERMEHFVESGVYDALPGDDDVEPEQDPTTYNGSIWLLARQTYWDDPNVPPDPGSPAFQSALAFYARRAVRPEYRWSWRNAQLEQDLFRRTITSSNDAFRRSVQDLGAVIANHVLSTVDAYITLRLRAQAGGRYGFEAHLPFDRLPARGRKETNGAATRVR